MASGLSNSADITRNDNEGGFIKAENDVTKAFYPRIVKICDDQAQCSTGETTNVGTNESSQANIPTRSEHGQKFDVFLSHSGKQKNFVRQLHRDLMNHGMYCFYDEDPESLRVGEDFPPRIFEAAKTCDLAVFLLSKEFLESKWPMLELSACVEARKSNPNLKLLPLFFMIPPEALKQMKADNGKWKEIGISEKEQTKWHEDLKAIGRINGLKLSEGGNEMEFRDKIVKEICRKLPTYSKRYHVPCMEGEERMCQEVAELFNTVQTNEKGIRIAGLHGIAGHGKTKLGKAFCNFKLKDFEGKVCHLEFSRGDPFQRVKHALQCLTHSPQSHLQTLTIEDQAQVELYKRVKGQRVLLVLDNITEESIREVTYYVQADFWENSCILLIARSVDFLVNHFEIESQSCMRVPSLEEDEAIRILLERTSLGESTLGAEDRSFALKCAKRCLFKEISCDNVRRGRTFHPLALKAFGGHLSGKWGSNLPKWVGEIDGLVDRSGYGLGDVMTVLSTAFDNMCPAYRTIFMLLTVYMLPNMSPNKVTEWLAMNCNQEISFIEKAVKDLCKKAFIEEFEPEIRIHDLYIEFAQSKANEMGRWLWWKGDQRSTRGFGSQDNRGFELVKLEQCKYRNPSQIPPRCLQNILVLQLVDVQVRNRGKLDLGEMNSLRSITLHNCADLEAIEGMKNLLELAWLQISEVHPMFKLPELSSLLGLQHLEIDIAVSQVFCLGDLTFCFNLREIKVRCRFLMEFPRLTGLPHLEKVEFSVCVKVKGPLDCTDCVELQSVVLDSCCEMDVSPLLAGCKKLSKVALSECDAVTACPDIDVPSALKSLELFISSKAASAPKCLVSCDGVENLQLWNMGELKQLPSFRRLSNLTVLKLGKCGITEPPDLACCVMLEHVCFSTLNNLERFPNFSSLRKLKILSLYNCRKVQDPPDIVGCHKLQVFNLLYNDNLKGLPKMDGYPRLEQIKMSWKCEDEVIYDGIDPDNWEVDDDDDSWLEHFKDEIFHFREFPQALKGWEWLKGKAMLAKKYFRGVKVYYSVTAPYEISRRSKFNSQNSITLSLRDNKVTAFPTPGRVVEDPVWLSKVQEYFGGEEDNSPISTAAWGEATNVGINESSQANIPTRSEHGQKFDLFLSHSGKQKNFVRQLHRDLTNHGMYCFFDEDPESLRVGEDFPPRIFEAAKTCDLAVFLLSKEFLESKWPMQELSACVEARNRNPNLELLPLFFMIPTEALKQMKADNEKWKEIGISEEERTKWHEALKAIRRINGLKLSEGGNEMEFRDKIVKEICRKLPTYSKRYHVPCMQGEERMCQEVEEFFKTVQTNEKGIRIAGLHGIAGHGKTTLGKAICNFKLRDFEGKVCHLEFSRGDPFQRVKHALQCLTHSPQSHLQTLTIEDQAQVELYRRVKGQRVLLVLDNITEESIREVTYYVQADFWENRCILLIARSIDVLVKHFEIESQSCMRVPSLEEDEAIRILLERTEVLL